MRYFFIEAEKQIVNAPMIINWTNKVDARNLKWGSYHKIEPRTLLEIKSNRETVFPDILSMPFFLISKNIKDVLSIYEPNMGFKEFLLADFKYELVNQYFLPQLEEFDCLSQESQLNLDRSVITKAILDESNIGDKCLFSIANVKNRYVVARLDFLESMIRRNAIFKFTELSVR